ncbi:site-specific integrase [Diaphorobacter sp. HDW4A]|uniref:tyrosine-type recombinase/integrase n=1 Tax=Diaphorobacter sp. HDW4A TaxID=2714924 RepID=UPI001F0FDA04|nr:site-specific integrase [Diaphorobacter sp. HDW4A]
MTALEVSRLREDGAHAVGGVTGLYLQIIGGSRVWVYRYVFMHHRRRMGLGSYPAVTLASAREAARAAMGLRDSGTDPLKARSDEREAARRAAAKQLPFQDAAEAYITEHESTWRNAKHPQQWRNTLKMYAYPKIGDVFVSEIDAAHVLRCITPIWKTKTETASRVRGRIEQVLDWAAAHGHRSGPNPARWRGQLQHVLPNPKKVAPVKHLAAIPFDDLPKVYSEISTFGGQSARALRLLILTAARSSEARYMRWEELDLDAGVWTIPAERMKAGRAHRVPLSTQALAIIEGQSAFRDREFVFPSVRNGPLSDMALTVLMRKHHLAAVPHGFRSTFRDWAGETTHHPRDAVELCLAHSIDTKTEAAYRRADMLEKRAVIMQEWADYALSALANQTTKAAATET